MNKEQSETSRRSSVEGSGLFLRKRSLMNAPSKRNEDHQKLNCVKGGKDQVMEHLAHQPKGLRSCISCPENESKTNKKSLSVGYTEIVIREYERILDINPSVTSGPALGLGWRYVEQCTLTVDEYETFREEHPRRSRLEFQMPLRVRETIAREQVGCTRSEIQAATKQCNIARGQRRVTNLNHQSEAASILMESAVRKLKRFVKGTTSKREMERLWMKAGERAETGQKQPLFPLPSNTDVSSDLFSDSTVDATLSSEDGEKSLEITVMPLPNVPCSIRVGAKQA